MWMGVLSLEGAAGNDASESQARLTVYVSSLSYLIRHIFRAKYCSIAMSVSCPSKDSFKCEQQWMVKTIYLSILNSKFSYVALKIRNGLVSSMKQCLHCNSKKDKS